MKISVEQRNEIRRLAKVELSRRSLFEFVKYTHHDFLANWFHDDLCAKLESFLSDVRAGKSPKLMIFAPPRHGKTEIVSRRFPAWVFGRDPNAQIISCSYAADLAARNNRDVQRIIDDRKYVEIFPGTSLNTKSTVQASGIPLRNSDIFEIVGHRGSYRGAGVGGGITGMGFDIGIIDDPIKNPEEANSQHVRDSIYEWYTTTFYTRRSPMSGIIIIMTRWHMDDLCGRLLTEEKGTWQVCSYPAVADSDEQHRKAGDPLDGRRYPLEILEQTRATLGSRNFAALYQQSPIVIGGQLIRGEWFKFYKQLPFIEYRFITADTAQKTKERNDYSVFACWGIGSGKLYLIDILRGKWEAPELKRRATAFWDKHKEVVSGYGNLRHVFVEDKVSGTGLIQEWQNDGGVPVVAMQRKTDKYTRCLDVVGQIEAGNVLLPEGAPFVSDFIAECEGFTSDDSHAFDDQVDCLVDAVWQGLAQVANRGLKDALENFNRNQSIGNSVSSGADW
jgi:predicted phage terminase large subunit-like protein